ncbi:hypothetical protein Nepgr_013443 [Nepenthes gracilis]|uniref:Uncharacterized protein n=1 Tax=Nepenthes gracilis TaxID=150966 RepID=A0AAD3SI45_NEPGR|nr:hypothetical protein Nepgr_013443 [Nepenthes gracilis]
MIQPAIEVDVGYQWKPEKGGQHIKKNVLPLSSFALQASRASMNLQLVDCQNLEPKSGISFSILPNNSSSSPLKHVWEKCPVQLTSMERQEIQQILMLLIRMLVPFQIPVVNSPLQWLHEAMDAPLLRQNRPLNISLRPLNDLSVLEASCVDPKTHHSEQDQLILPESVEAIDTGAYVRVDSYNPLGDVQEEGALNINSISDGISMDTQESKLKNLSPLARKVAARIKALLRADDQS